MSVINSKSDDIITTIDRDRSGELPLMTAILKDDHNMIKLLMKCGAHLATACRPTGEMITMAIKNGSLKRMDTLKLAGADLDTFDELLQTPLHKAVLYNSPEIATFLLNNGVNKYKKDILNHTALDYAVKLSRHSMIRLLQDENECMCELSNTKESDIIADIVPESVN